MDEMFFAFVYALLAACIGLLQKAFGGPDHPLMQWYSWAVAFMLYFFGRGYYDWWVFDAGPLFQLWWNHNSTIRPLPSKIDTPDYRDHSSLAGPENIFVLSLALWLPTLGWIGMFITVKHVVMLIAQHVRTITTRSFQKLLWPFSQDEILREPFLLCSPQERVWSLDKRGTLTIVIMLLPGLFTALSMRSIIRCLELLTHSAWYGKLATVGSDAWSGDGGWHLFNSILAKLGLKQGNVHYNVIGKNETQADDLAIQVLVFRTAEESLSLANFIQYFGIGCFVLLIHDFLTGERKMRRLLGAWFHVVVGLILEFANIGLDFQAHKRDAATRELAEQKHQQFVQWYMPIFLFSMVVCVVSMSIVLQDENLRSANALGQAAMQKFVALRGLLIFASVQPRMLDLFQCAGDSIDANPPTNSTCPTQFYATASWMGLAGHERLNMFRLGPQKALLANAALLLFWGVILSAVNAKFWRKLP